MKNGKRRRAWTSVQVRELKSLAKKKTPARKIAKSLKRTEGATRQKAFSMGLSLDSARLTHQGLKLLQPCFLNERAPPLTCAGLFP